LADLFDATASEVAYRLRADLGGLVLRLPFGDAVSEEEGAADIGCRSTGNKRVAARPANSSLATSVFLGDLRCVCFFTELVSLGIAGVLSRNHSLTAERTFGNWRTEIDTVAVLSPDIRVADGE
jgi:hypothetical protein